MIKSGIKNYFVNLKHFFTPIGTLAAGLFIGFSIFIPGALAILSALIERLSEIVQDASIDFAPLKDSVVDAVRALDWNDPIAALKIVFSRDWLEGVLNAALNAISNGLQPFADAIGEAVTAAVEGIKFLFAVVIIFAVVGLICGYCLTRFLVRKTMAKRTFKKFLFAVFVDSLVSAALLSLCLWLVTKWAPSIFLTSLLSLAVFGSVALVSAYLVHGRGNVAFKDVLNFKNVFSLLLINALIFLISLVFLALTILITNPIAGILIGFSFVEIAFLVMSMNAESYVIKLAANKPPQEEPVEQTELPTEDLSDAV